MNIILKFKDVILLVFYIILTLLATRGALGFWEDRNFFYNQEFSWALVKEWLWQFKKRK